MCEHFHYNPDLYKIEEPEEDFEDFPEDAKFVLSQEYILYELIRDWRLNPEVEFYGPLYKAAFKDLEERLAKQGWIELVEEDINDRSE